MMFANIHATAITIGFLNTNYVVGEDFGVILLTVSVNETSFGKQFSTSIKVAAMSAEGIIAIYINRVYLHAISVAYFCMTALSDLEVNTTEANFSPTVLMQTFEVAIVDDILLEADEEFQLILEFNELVDAKDNDRIFLMPHRTNITIRDNDSKAVTKKVC